MRLTMPSGVPEGIPLTVMPFREDAVIGTMSLATLVRLVPSPRQEEDPRALKTASGHDRRHAELRATVQRTLKSQKGRTSRTTPSTSPQASSASTAPPGPRPPSRSGTRARSPR
ncbi:hypothetical protein GCM10018980_20800 [Streptomyces capoamus]|uniref:Uncharacterized protein n=1 Tax=Streptomyces capoamus TaxID=68183 RepID=A0A919C276_9ACTN|nr:hypothetical protein GCM10010501_03060 [Streptomyces libani subsp. rufus]GHG43733.1 hypothetical protein GCM10018980_20800 [Streptomyces capoamus]